MKRAKSKSSAPPASETQARPVAVPALPPDVRLISQAELDNIEESLQAVRRHLTTILFNAEDGTRDEPSFSRSSTRENIFKDAAAALMGLNILEEAMWSAGEPRFFLMLHGGPR